MNKSRCICIFIVFFLFCFLFFSQPAFAKPIGADAPCRSCCEQTSPDIPSGPGPCPDVSGGSFISYSHGNMGDSYPVISTQGANKAGLDLTLYYASYIADGEKASLSTVMGFGWSHSYNIFLFQQGRDIFKMSPGGLVTQYKRTGRTGPLKATRGHQQTIIENPDGSIEIRNKDGITYRFEKITGNPLRIIGKEPLMLTGITNRNGNTIELIYQNGLLWNVKDEYGRQIGFEYDMQNRIIKITDPKNRITEMAYDSYDNLSDIKDPLGQTITYTYNERHQIVGKSDKNGNQWQYEYDATGHPVGIRDGNGNRLFSLSNSSGWETSSYDLFREKQRTYTPSVTTRTDGRGNQWQYHYNEDGFITKIVAPDGVTTIYSYDPVTLNLETETDCKGNTTSYEYDSKGNRTKVTDALGNETAYTYDPTYCLVTSMTDPDGDVTTYEYDASGDLIKETDPLGNATTYTYDSHGNILCETDCNGNTTCYEYNTYGNRIKEIDPLGCETHYAYDIIGNMLSRTDANGHTTTYEYDLLDRLVKETDPKGCIITYTYDGEGNRLTVTDAKGTTSYEYDLRDRLVRVTDAKGGVTSYAYDKNDNKISETNARGFTTAYEYDSQNHFIKTTDAKNCITAITYDCAGNRSSETDASGNITTYEYDPLNRLIKTTDPLGNTTIYTYNGAGGGGCSSCCGSSTSGSSLIASITDANGNVTCYKYDKLDRQIKVIRKVGDPDCSIIDADDAVTEYTYDCIGNRITLTDENGNTTTYTYNARHDLVQECNPEGECTQYTYDCVGNMLTETRPNGNVINYTYDEKDQLITIIDSIGKIASYTYDCVGTRIAEEDGNNNKTRYEYDELNRLIKVTDPMNEFITYEYDSVGNLIKVTDREGNQTSYTYDEVNHRLTVTDALNSVTSYEYDCMGNLIKITDCNGNSTTYEYDPLNILIKETYADGGTKEFAYDSVGNLITRIDQNGIITSYQYDELYRLIKRDYPGANDDTFSYDMGGRMLTADNLHSAITFSYDGANRVTQTTQNGLAVSYTYDTANNKSIVVYPSGKVIKKEMDKRDRLKAIKDAIDHIIAENTYDLGDRMTERVFLNTMETGWDYNQNNWVIQLIHVKGTSTLIDFEYNYDKEGNRLYTRKNHDTSNSEKYTYDALYRITEFKKGTLVSDDIPSPVKQCSWTLDCVGNWLKGPLPCPQPGGCSITSNEVNEYTSICGVNQTHDNNGNLSDDGINTYEYDYENRLVTVIRKSDSAILGEYRYDALGRRVEKEVSGVVTRFVYDKASIIEERHGGSVVAEYVYGTRIDEVLTMDRGGYTYYYHTNALGSIVALANSAGDIIEHYQYDAYGKPEIFVDPGADGTWFTADDVAAAYSSAANSYLFTGRRLDEETGLYYYRARYYDSERGRFLQRDPLGYVDGMNLYEFVVNNPVRYSDPFGERKCCPISLKIKKVRWHVPSTDNRLALEFTMTAKFKNAPREDCCCECCSYRQYVRGAFVFNGRDWNHRMGPGANDFLHRTIFREDGGRRSGNWFRYGHRGDEANGDRYVNGGCEYRGWDRPGITATNQTRYSFQLVFRGRIIDTCNGNKELRPKRTWGLSADGKWPGVKRKGEWGFD